MTIVPEKILWVLLLLAGPVFFASCKSGEAGGLSDTPAYPSDLFVKVYHQGCRGYCPDYYLSVDAKGMVEYEGRHAVDLMGKYKKEIPLSQVAKIWKTIEEADFWSFDDEYGTEVADLPEVHTTVIANAKKKRTRNVRNGPATLTDLEKTIEALIGQEDLEKID